MKLNLVLKKIYEKITSRSALFYQIQKKPNFEDTVYTKQTVNNFRVASAELLTVFSGFDNFEGISIYVHGSWADDTKTPFSDLDDLVIIDREKFRGNQLETIKLLKWLTKVEMRFQRLDLIQHHGHWIIFEDNLNDYDESYMPIGVLQNAVYICGLNRISYSINTEKSLLGLENNINITLFNINQLMELYYKDKVTYYDMKCLIGSFLLIPAYLFQMKRINVSKREGIERRGEIFSLEVCRLYDKCSEIRTKWEIVSGLPRFKIIKVLSYIVIEPNLFRRLSKRISPRFPRKNFPIFTKDELIKFLIEVQVYVNTK